MCTCETYTHIGPNLLYCLIVLSLSLSCCSCPSLDVQDMPAVPSEQSTTLEQVSTHLQVSKYNHCIYVVLQMREYV